MLVLDAHNDVVMSQAITDAAGTAPSDVSQSRMRSVTAMTWSARRGRFLSKRRPIHDSALAGSRDL